MFAGTTRMVLFTLLAASCADVKPTAPTKRGAAGHDHGVTGARHAGDRVGLHGMVLFGRTSYFLEHIPMFRRPHDEQLVMRVTLRDAAGTLLERDFGDATYTLEPSTHFSLDDLALGKRATFAGNIYRGSFEAGGAVLLRGVQVSVDDVLVARGLPGTEPIAADQQEYFLVGAPGDAYLTNMIRASRGEHHVLRVAAVTGIVPSPSRAHRITTTARRRLAPSTQVIGSVPSAGAGSTRVVLDVAAELWCVRGPEFFERCL